MDKYRVSIIMGIYNCEKTLDASIKSLCNQTFKKWKLIMCDDGSTDSTYSIAKKYADRFENIELYRNKKNMGLNYTLNHCLEYVDTEYVARMDGDDISLNNRLQREVEFLDKHKEYAIVSAAMISFDENGDWGIYKNPENPSYKNFLTRSPFCHAPSMVRKEAYDAVGGYTVDEKLLRMEDIHLWTKMYAKGYKGFNLNEPLYKMRDDRNATKRRKYKFRINEAYARHLVVKSFRLPFYYNIFALRPLVVGIIPTKIYETLHKRGLKK